MAASSLQNAAQEAYAHMFVRWEALTLEADMALFLDALVVIFSKDGTVNERTVSNWIVVGRNIVASVVDPVHQLDDYDFFNNAVEMVYRVCLAADVASTIPPLRITVPQATAILAAYNATLD